MLALLAQLGPSTAAHWPFPVAPPHCSVTGGLHSPDRSSWPRWWMRTTPPRSHVLSWRPSHAILPALCSPPPLAPGRCSAVPSAWRPLPLPADPAQAKSSSLRIKMRAMFQGTFSCQSPPPLLASRSFPHNSHYLGRAWGPASLPIGHQFQRAGRGHSSPASALSPGPGSLNVGSLVSGEPLTPLQSEARSSAPCGFCSSYPRWNAIAGCPQGTW